MNISNNPTFGFIVAVAAIGGVILGGVALSSSVSSKKAAEDLNARMTRDQNSVADLSSQVSALSGRTQGSLEELRQEVWVLRDQLSNTLARAAGPAKTEVKKGEKADKGEKTTEKTTEKTEVAVAGAGTTHTIAAGDTLGKMAKKYHTSIEAIQKLNPGVDSSHLKIGQKIRVQ